MTVKVHLFPEYSTSEMYDITQTSEDIKDGDLFVCNGGGTVGFLMKAWPTALFGEVGYLELATPEGVENFRKEYPETFARVEALRTNLFAADRSTVRSGGQ